MKFHKVPNEYRMISDEDNYELFVLSRGREEDDHHFRLVSPLQKLDFDARPVFEPAPEWHVFRIVLYSREVTAESSNEMACLADLTIHGIIEQALSDFGYFYGLEAGRFGIRFVTDKIHHPH